MRTTTRELGHTGHKDTTPTRITFQIGHPFRVLASLENPASNTCSDKLEHLLHYVFPVVTCWTGVQVATGHVMNLVIIKQTADGMTPAAATSAACKAAAKQLAIFEASEAELAAAFPEHADLLRRTFVGKRRVMDGMMQWSLQSSRYSTPSQHVLACL
jgi:hypothetical protein